MSSQLVFQAQQDQYYSSTPTYTSSNFRIDNADASENPHHPYKRPRIDQDHHFPSAPIQTVRRDPSEFENPRPLPITSISNPCLPTSVTEHNLQERPATVAEQHPQNKAIGRRKAKQFPQDGSPFIIEAVSFPDHQPWLKVRPRRRRAAVDVSKDVVVPDSTLPEEGEVLSLDRDADRIAVLIAQKRKENESSQFRQRMATQQRVHRGELDKSEKSITASNNELKRKMELGAKGIFEDKVPNGKEPVVPAGSPDLEFTPKLEPNTSSSEKTAGGAHSSTVIPVPTTGDSGKHQSELSIEHGSDSIHDVMRDDDTVPNGHGYAQEGDNEEDLESALSDPVPLQDIHDDTASPVSPQTYLQYQQNMYYQTMVSSQMNMGSSQAQMPSVPHVPQHMQSGIVYQRPTLLDHQQHYVPNWYEAQPHLQDTWTQQIFHSLPSTQTPVMQLSDLSQHSNNEVSSLPANQGVSSSTDSAAVSQQQRAIRLFDMNPPSNPRSPRNSESSEDAVDRLEELNRSSSSTNLFNNLSSNLHPARFDPQPPILRSNMNMFTRSARENGVIGGNNNTATASTERRNMFASNR